MLKAKKQILHNSTKESCRCAIILESYFCCFAQKHAYQPTWLFWTMSRTVFMTKLIRKWLKTTPWSPSTFSTVKEAMQAAHVQDPCEPSPKHHNEPQSNKENDATTKKCTTLTGKKTIEHSTSDQTTLKNCFTTAKTRQRQGIYKLRSPPPFPCALCPLCSEAFCKFEPTINCRTNAKLCFFF